MQSGSFWIITLVATIRVGKGAVYTGAGIAVGLLAHPESTNNNKEEKRRMQRFCIMPPIYFHSHC
jgi:hypothetical protein